MASRKGAGGTPATVALTRAGVTFTEHAYEHDPAARVVRDGGGGRAWLDPARVFKTLLVVGRLPPGGASCRSPGSSTSRPSPLPSAARRP